MKKLFCLFVILLLTSCANVGGGASVSGGTNSGVNVGGSIGVHFPFNGQ